MKEAKLTWVVFLHGSVGRTANSDHLAGDYAGVLVILASWLL
jgi:hypothetical protein